jgi:hypothetical protein
MDATEVTDVVEAVEAVEVTGADPDVVSEPVDPELGMPESEWLAQAQRDWDSPSWRWSRIMEPGPDSGDPSCDALLLERLADIEGLISQLQVMAGQDLRRLRDRYLGVQDRAHGEDAPDAYLDQDGWLPCEAGLVLGLSERQVRSRLHQADRLARYPRAAELAADGRISAFPAIRLVELLDELGPLTSAKHVARVEAETVGWLRQGRRKRVGELTRRLRRIILTARALYEARQAADPDPDPDPDPGTGPDPDAGTDGGGVLPPSPAHARRAVRFDSRGDGTAEMWALLPEADALAVAAALDNATASRDEDDDRGRDQRRADALVAYLTGSVACYGQAGDLPNGRPAGAGMNLQCTLTVPVRTVTGHGGSPGEVPGWGLIPASTVADLLASPSVDFDALLYDADTGRLAGLSPHGNLDEVHWHHRIPLAGGYPHPPRMQASTRARDCHCRFSGCLRPAARTDGDHVIPWPDGPTSTRNTASLCRFHHRMKTHAPGWQLSGTGDGPLTWTTPTGRTHQTEPNDYRDPSPRPQAWDHLPDEPPF